LVRINGWFRQVVKDWAFVAQTRIRPLTVQARIRSVAQFSAQMALRLPKISSVLTGKQSRGRASGTTGSALVVLRSRGRGNRTTRR
jgi:hypothetical protein